MNDESEFELKYKKFQLFRLNVMSSKIVTSS